MFIMSECEHCDEGWIEDERPESCGSGPSEHFHWIIYKEPCTHCNQADLDDDGQPDEAQEWHDFDPDC